MVPEEARGVILVQLPPFQQYSSESSGETASQDISKCHSPACSLNRRLFGPSAFTPIELHSRDLTLTEQVAVWPSAVTVAVCIPGSSKTVLKVAPKSDEPFVHDHAPAIFAVNVTSWCTFMALGAEH
jgi:hypothetical protein